MPTANSGFAEVPAVRSSVESRVDACVYHNWRSQADVMEYLPPAWRDYLGWNARTSAGPLPLTQALPRVPYVCPIGDYLPESYPARTAEAGSDRDLTTDQHLRPNGISRAVLCHDIGRSAPALVTPSLSLELTRALNRWSLDHWADGNDARYYYAILAPSQSPDAAADEIRKLARNPRCVAVMLGANGMNKPFGHPVYYPVYAAAVEAGLPLIVHSRGDEVADVLTQPSAGGMPATFSDLYVLFSQSLFTHMVDMIGMGVFEAFPELRVMLMGAGVAWVIPALWRFETHFRGFRRTAPWLNKSPIEYFEKHFWLGSHPLDEAASIEGLHRNLSVMDSLRHKVCYASGYPSWDRNGVKDVERLLPSAWTDDVLSHNAQAFFRWDTVEKVESHSVEPKGADA
jgi:uncharacterized protein